MSNLSTVRRETRQEFQIENTINGSGPGGKFSLSDTLRMQYQISRLDEYCDENMKSVREVFCYNAVEQDRDVVLWNLAEVLMLYRINRNNKIELVGMGEYYHKWYELSLDGSKTGNKQRNADMAREFQRGRKCQ